MRGKVAPTQDSVPLAEEEKYKDKCIELKNRIMEIEENNEIATIALARTKSSIKRLRLEYSVLTEKLEQNVILDEIDSEFNVASIYDANTINGAKYRDPSIPKRPTNPYLQFCEVEKDNTKKTISNFADLSKELAKKWKALTKEESKPYYNLYEEDKARYHRDMVAYSAKQSHSSLKAETDTEVPAAKRQKTNKPETDEEEQKADQDDAPSTEALAVSEPTKAPTSETIEKVGTVSGSPSIQTREDLADGPTPAQQDIVEDSQPEPDAE